MKRPGAEGQKRAALRALERAKRAAARTGTDLSAWEGEFLGSVEERVKTYGRAFVDPTKGSPGDSLSALQRLKLKEITRKAKVGGEPARAKPFEAKPGFRRPGRDRSPE